MSAAPYRAISHAFKGVRHSECLSFLYCTSTILAPRITHSRASHRPHRIISKHQVRNQHGLHGRSNNDIPFEGIQDYELENTEQPDSTLTRPEKLAFQHLRQRGQVDKDEDAKLNDAESSEDPYDDLYTMFDSMIKQQETHKTRGQDKVERNILRFEGKGYTRVLENLPDLGDRDTTRLKVKDGKIIREREQSQDTSGIAKACKEHLQRTRERLDAAVTDVEIWNILDQELFSIVQIFNERVKQEQKKEALRLKRKVSNPRTRSTKKDSVPAINDSAVLPENTSAESEPPSISHGNMSLTTNAMLAIIQENYAQLNLMALRLWRRRFAMTPYSLQILPHIKSLGNISYVLGASTGMYNEILFVKWTQYHDLHGIADLIFEMVNQGLGANQLTFQLLGSIDRTRTKDLSGHRGKVLRSWWILRGIKEAWIRLRAIYKQLEQEAGKPMGMSYSRLQGALDVQDYGEVVGKDRIPGT